MNTRQTGVALLFTLIVLAVMLIGGVALMQSFGTTLFMAGNLGFKRDIQNQSDRALVLTQAAFSATGGASGAAGFFNARSARAANSTANAAGINYSASVLASVDAQGVPAVLTRSDLTDPISGFALNPAYDLTSANDSTIDPSITIRFVVDRLCTTAGDEKTLGSAQCEVQNTPPTGTSSSTIKNGGSAPLCPTCQSAVPQLTVFRLSARVMGPRKTESFFQSTFVVPS